MITTHEAAKRLGKPGEPLSTQRIRQLIDDGKLVAIKVGRDWLIDEESVQERIESRERLKRLHPAGWKRRRMTEEKDCLLCGREHYGTGELCSSRCEELAAEDNKVACWPPQPSDTSSSEGGHS